MKHLRHIHKLILIGASTGGPRDIKKILKSIDKNLNATILIAQHMGNDFVSSFASHMRESCGLEIKVALHNEMLQNNTVYITSKHCHVIRNHENIKFHITDAADDAYNPNIDELFISCSRFSNSIDTLACILTGIGDDGAKGMLELSKRNASCITANKSSSAVYGMPQRAQEVSKDVKAMSLDDIIYKINSFGR